MKVFHNAAEAGRWAPASVAAIGKFDGLHLGHQRVIRLAVKRAKALSTKCLVVTFDPHPQEVLHPDSFRPLMSAEQKQGFLEDMGADAVLFLRFSRAFACQAPETFAKSILAGSLQVMDVYVGADFCFGKDRAGRVDTLVKLGKELGFLVHPVCLVYRDGARVSSSRIRRLIEEKRWAKVRTLIGRPLDGLARLRPGREIAPCKT